MTSSPMDRQIPDGLARAFRLPDWVAEQSEDLVDLHAEIVARLRREADGMPMNTVQQLLLERIAFNYIVLKYKDETNGFANPNEQKNFNSWWLSMTQEFNKLLLANDDKMRAALLMEVQGIVQNAVSLITDPTDRQNVRRFLSEGFASIDL